MEGKLFLEPLSLDFITFISQNYHFQQDTVHAEYHDEVFVEIGPLLTKLQYVIHTFKIIPLENLR